MYLGTRLESLQSNLFLSMLMEISGANRKSIMLQKE